MSVVMPAYNRARLLPRALNSGLEQTFHKFEVIVVDDDSSDDTHEVVAGMAATDARLRYIAHPANRRPNAARNTSIRAARGDYVALMDADDEWQAREIALCTPKQVFCMQTRQMVAGVPSGLPNRASHLLWHAFNGAAHHLRERLRGLVGRI